MKTTKKKSPRTTLEATLERAATASVEAEKAVASRDLRRAIKAVSKVNAITCAALALGAQQNKLGLVQNLMPNAVYYTKVLSELSVDPFEAVERLRVGSSIMAGGAA